jgi:superfamily I DNA/RNA helicase
MCQWLQIRLSKNYRSTRAIVEAATALIHNNTKRHHHKLVETDNPSGCKVFLIVTICYHINFVIYLYNL